jgi:predicted nucleic acid-binding protein
VLNVGLEPLCSAKTVSADFLVTGDLDLLSITKEKLKTVGLERLSIVTPRVFLERAKK